MSQDDYTLAYGTHATPEDGRCAMEWVSHLAGEAHSDAPACVSPVLRAICIALNDGLPDRPRQRLRPYLARTIGTAGDGLDERRAWMAMDWLVRTYVPRWLELAGLHGEAASLAACDTVTGERSLQAALGALAQAGAAARRARVTALAAERRAWGPFARLAATVTGWRTGREAAWACAGTAGWAAARLATDAPEGDRARTLIRAAAGDAATVAVRAAAGDDVCGPLGRRDALGTALGPTLEALADSAITLLDRMLVTEPLELADRPAAVLVAARG